MIVFEDLPGRTIAASSTVGFELGFARWSQDPVERKLTLRWSDGGPVAERDLSGAGYDLVKTADIVITAPAVAGSVELVAEVTDGAGARIAANRLRVTVE
jgi:hypothetical protein